MTVTRKKKIQRKLREKKVRISALKKLADKYFSVFIRKRGMDSYGFNTCFTCNVRKPWKELQCGHYVSRSYLSLRYSEGNCHPQCVACNVFKKGNLDVYALKLMNVYGGQTLRQLDEQKWTFKKMGTIEYSKIIQKYGLLNSNNNTKTI